jgi:hypothetical protein
MVHSFIYYFLITHFNIILLSTESVLSAAKIVCATHPIHLILLDVIALTTLFENY